jgi:hypothetical protein
MKNTLFSALILCVLVLSGCKKEENQEPVQPAPSITTFSFLKNNNVGLNTNIVMEIVDNQISGRLPYTARIENLVATFNYTGDSIFVNNIPQTSSNSVVDFSDVITYTITNQDGTIVEYKVDATWFTGLPMFNIITNNGEEILSTDEYIQGKVIAKGGRTFDDVTGEMGIRGRGHSTWFFHPKKPYQLKFDNKTEVFGMPADKKWILLAEHSDKTLIRNTLAFEMGYISNLDWTPKCVYAEVFINEDYRGTYNITQKVEEGDHRVNLGNDGYLLEIDTPDHLEEEDIFFYSSKFMFQIKEPETTFDSPEFNLIKDHIAEFESVLFGNQFLDPVHGYKTYIDMASFVDWFLINEMAKNQDAKDYSSIYVNYNPGQKLKMGPLWDFDLGFGNVDYSECEFPSGFWVKNHAWISRMFEDPDFVSQVKTRFAYFKSKEDYLLQVIDDKASLLKWAQEENDARWDWYGNYVWPNPVVFNTHQEEVDHLKDWFVQRMTWLNNAFDSL